MDASEFWTSRDWPTTFEALANVAQVIAFAAAGWWTYRLFVRQRHARQRANLTHKLTELGVVELDRIVRVEVAVQNIGNVILIPPKGAVKLYQVRPVPGDIAPALAVARTTSDASKDRPPDCEFPWPRLRKTTFVLGDDNMVLEPGESDSLACDFAIPLAVNAVFVRSELFCGDPDAPDQHWHHETLHEFIRSNGAA